MDTPLELHALRQLPELRAAEILIGRTRGELLAVCNLCHIRPKRGAEKLDLVAAILTVTHPRPAAPAPAPVETYQQAIF